MSLMDFDDEILLQKQGFNTAKARHNKALSSKGIKILRQKSKRRSRERRQLMSDLSSQGKHSKGKVKKHKSKNLV